jgi:hypothetical protein
LIGGSELDEVLRFGQLTFVDGQECLIGPKVRASQTFVGMRTRPRDDWDAAIAVGCGSFRTTAIPQKTEDFAEFANC